MSKLKASVQYDDWQGTVAGDDATNGDIGALFNPHKGANESLVGWSFYASENGTASLKGVFVAAVGFDNAKAVIDSSDPVPVRTVEINLTAGDFVALFKRLHIVGMRKGLNLANRELDGLEL